MNKNITITFLLILLPNVYGYIADSSFVILDSNKIDTLASINKGAHIYECVKKDNDTIKCYVIPGKLDPKTISLEQINKYFKNDSNHLINNKIPIYQSYEFKDIVGYIYPRSEKIGLIGRSVNNEVQYDIIVPTKSLSNLRSLQNKDWQVFILNAIKKGDIFGSQYEKVKNDLLGVFYHYPEDSTWFRNGYVYCELGGRYDNANGEISSVLILKEGKIKFIWTSQKISDVPFIKIKPGYVYYKSKDNVPHFIIKYLESFVLCEKGIGSPSVEK